MEEADLKLKQSDSGRKRMRRRTHTRKAPLTSCFFNMAEARREIVNALQLHRSSSSSSAAATSDSKTCINSPNYPAILSSFNHQNIKYYHHGLMNSMPIPEPTWSTTPPSVSVQLSTPAIPAVHDQVLMDDQFEWFDHNLSSSYSWWVGFLNSLDTKNSSTVSELMENSQVLDLRRCLDADQKSDHQVQSPFIDEWLIFPATEEHEEKV